MQTIKISNARWVRSARSRINRENKAFKNATKRERIVLVAQDVISLLALDAITPTNGSYMRVGLKPKASKKFNAESEVQDLFANPLGKSFPKCDVCAVGAAMLSSIRLANKLKFKDFYTDRGSYLYNGQDGSLDGVGHFMAEPDVDRSPWRKTIGEELLSAMEDVFEHNNCSVYADLDDPTLTMFAVYENIVMNEGKLKVPKPSWHMSCQLEEHRSNEMRKFKKETRGRFDALRKVAKKKD